MFSIKRFLPKSLLGRSLLIIVTPLVLLQIVSAVIFFENHWNRVALRLARNVAGDVAMIIQLLNTAEKAAERERLFDLSADHFEMVVTIRPGEKEPFPTPDPQTSMDKILFRALESYVAKPVRIDTESLERHVIIDVQFEDWILECVTTRKRLFSSTTYVFVIWMVGTSMILFGVATIFMRNQVKPIRRLAVAADNFGKGQDVTRFKPEGATEVRLAATAFVAMRERIQRHITQRTEMLAGVSHDLRTPLTRMKLELAMLGETDGVDDLKEDVGEMERMLEGYLAFARGEGAEQPIDTDLGQLLADVVAQTRRQGVSIDLHVEKPLSLPLRPNAFKRCIANVVGNASRYASHVNVRMGARADGVEVTIDDDGPGIPEDKRDDVFKPFFRVDQSRNQGTGGVGLGLTIARDVVRVHGGDIGLETSPFGGLRVRIRIPV